MSISKQSFQSLNSKIQNIGQQHYPKKLFRLIDWTVFKDFKINVSKSIWNTAKLEYSNT